MSVHRDYEEKAAEVVALVAPWLPDAVVTEFDIQESCGCYSEYTQEPAYLHITLTAPRPEDDSDQALGGVVGALETIVQPWAARSFAFSGCSSCADGEPEDGCFTFWLRVIRAIAKAEGDTGGLHVR